MKLLFLSVCLLAVKINSRITSNGDVDITNKVLNDDQRGLKSLEKEITTQPIYQRQNEVVYPAVHNYDSLSEEYDTVETENKKIDLTRRIFEIAGARFSPSFEKQSRSTLDMIDL